MESITDEESQLALTPSPGNNGFPGYGIASNVSRDFATLFRTSRSGNEGVRSEDFSSKIHAIIGQQAKSWNAAKLSVVAERDSLREKLKMARELTDQQKQKLLTQLSQKEALEIRLSNQVRKQEHALAQLNHTLKSHERYQNVHKKLEADMERLRHKVESYSANMESHRKEREQIAQKYKQLETGCAAKSEECRALDEALKESREMWQSLSLQNQVLEENVARQTQKYEHVAQEKLSLEKQVMTAQLKEEAFALAAQQQEAKLAESRAHYEALMRDLQVEKTACKSEVAIMRAELAATVLRTEEILKAQSAEFSHFKEAASTCNEKATFFQSKCDNLEDLLNQARLEAQDCTNTKANLELQLLKTQEELSQLQIVVSEKDENLAKLKQQATDTRDKDIMEKATSDLRAEVSKWEYDYENLAYGFDHFRKRSDNLGSVLSQRERELLQYRQERADWQEKIGAMEFDNKNLNEQVSTLEKHLKKVSETMTTLRQQHVQKIEKTQQDFEARFGNLLLELEREKNHVHDLDAMLQTEQKLNANQRAELDNWRASMERNKNEIASLEQQLVHKRGRIGELEASVKNLEQMVESLQADCSTRKAVNEDAPKVPAPVLVTHINHESSVEPAAMCSQPKSSGRTLFDQSPPNSPEAPLFSSLSPCSSTSIIKRVHFSAVPQQDPDWIRPKPTAQALPEESARYSADPYVFKTNFWDSDDSLGFNFSTRMPAKESFADFNSTRKRINLEEPKDRATPAKVQRDENVGGPSKVASTPAAAKSKKTSSSRGSTASKRGRGRGCGRGRGGVVGCAPSRSCSEKAKDVTVDSDKKFFKTSRAGRKTFPKMNPVDLYAALCSSDSDFD